LEVVKKEDQMQKKLAELIYLGMKEGKDFEKETDEVKLKFMLTAKVALLAIDKMEMELVTKAGNVKVKKSAEVLCAAIANILPAELSKNNFVAKGVPKVAPEYWTELAKKIVAL